MLLFNALKLLDQAMSQTRTISHLLHPALLDETGFGSAAKWYVEEFAKRSGVRNRSRPCQKISAGYPGSLARAACSAFSRKGWTNVHRHSKSKKADVSFKILRRTRWSCGIRDYGKGIPANVWTVFAAIARTAGWGWPGCASAVRELGGQLEMDSDGGALRSWQL